MVFAVAFQLFAVVALGQTPTEFSASLEHLSDVLSEVEGKIGREKTAELFIAAADEAQRSALQKVKENLSTVDDAKAATLLDELEQVYAASGSASARRMLRNAKRNFSDLREQIAATLDGIHRAKQGQELQKLLADNDGSVSKMLRSAVRQMRWWDDNQYRLQDPFVCSRAWLGWAGNFADNAPMMIVMGFWSVLVLPFTISIDAFLLPFQVVYWTGYVVHDFLTTTGEEERIAEREAAARAAESQRRDGYQEEISQLRNRLRAVEAELREKLQKATEETKNNPEPPTIRR